MVIPVDDTMFPELPLTTIFTLVSFNTIIGDIHDNGRFNGPFLFKLENHWKIPKKLFCELMREFFNVEFVSWAKAPRALFRKIPRVGKYTQLPPGPLSYLLFSRQKWIYRRSHRNSTSIFINDRNRVRTLVSQCIRDRI